MGKNQLQLPCTGFRLLGCMLISLSGLLVIASVPLEAGVAVKIASLAMYSAGIAATPLVVSSPTLALAILALNGIALAPLVVSTGLWPVFTMLSLIAALASIRERASNVAPLLAPPVALTASLSPGDYRWIILSAYIAFLGFSTAVQTRSVHTLLLAAGLIVPILLPGYPAVIAALATLLVYLAVNRAVERYTCPFRVDSKSLFAGSVLALIGFASWIAGLEAVGRPVAAVGIVILVASNLSPTSFTLQGADALKGKEEKSLE